MPVVNVTLLLDDETYLGVKSGTLELGGLVKDSSNKIRKHLPAVVDAAKDGASKAIDLVRGHKKELLIVSGFVIIGGVVCGTVSHLTTKEKRKAEQNLGKSFDAYLEATTTGVLTVEILNQLIADLETVSKYRKDDSIPLKLSATQLTNLFYSLYDFTKRMAEANNASVNVQSPHVFKKNSMKDLRNYLDIQKSIIENAA